MNTELQAPKESQASLILWLLSGCFLIFLMVVIGGITRLTHSGLSITEWNLLMGTLPPLNGQQWQELFEKYQQSPEFREVHYFFTLSDFKSIFWWEYIHRLLGRLIGIVFIVPFFYFLVKRKISRALLPKLILIFLLGALQGFLGWFMVKSGLVNKPAVSHYRLAAHLITAFATFGYIVWVVLGITSLQPPHATSELFSKTKNLKQLRGLAFVLFFVIIVQVIFGAFVAGLKAGYLYPTFPRMGTEWMAEEINTAFAENGWVTFVENGAAVQFIHRWLGILILFIAIALWLAAKRMEMPFRMSMAVRLMIVMVLLQFALGLFTLLYSVPVHLAVLHQAGAFFLFGASLFLLHEMKRETSLL